MTKKITACSVVRDAIIGGIPLFEAMSVILPHVDNMLIVDAGSKDGTYKKLLDIASSNNKVQVEVTACPKHYPDLLNLQLDTIASARFDSVLYFDGFEIFNNRLLALMRNKFDEEYQTILFWQGSYSHNFQIPQGFPQARCRAGQKDSLLECFNATFADVIVSNLPTWYDWKLSDYERWYKEFVLRIEWNTAFIHNSAERRKIDFFTDYESEMGQWYREESGNPDWLKKETCWPIPDIMKPHLGKSRYEVDQKLIERLKELQ